MNLKELLSLGLVNLPERKGRDLWIYQNLKVGTHEFTTAER